MILKHVWSFSRNPEYLPYPHMPTGLRLKILFSAVFWNLTLSLALVLIAEGLIQGMGVDIGRHKTEDLLSSYSLPEIFFLMVFLAPVLEEALFRGPLIFFRKYAWFPFIFYLSCLAFGMVHLGNFENADTLLPWAPLLVAPQTVMGFFLGYLRVRLGLRYAILMHACHNGFIFILLLLIENPL